MRMSQHPTTGAQATLTILDSSGASIVPNDVDIALNEEQRRMSKLNKISWAVLSSPSFATPSSPAPRGGDVVSVGFPVASAPTLDSPAKPSCATTTTATTTSSSSSDASQATEVDANADTIVAVPVRKRCHNVYAEQCFRSPAAPPPSPAFPMPTAVGETPPGLRSGRHGPPLARPLALPNSAPRPQAPKPEELPPLPTTPPRQGSPPPIGEDAPTGVPVAAAAAVCAEPVRAAPVAAAAAAAIPPAMAGAVAPPPGTVHGRSLWGVLRWVPYPTAQNARLHGWGETAHAAPAPGATIDRLFFGNLWTNFIGAPMVNFLVDVLVELPLSGAFAGPRVARWEQHSKTVTLQSGERKMWVVGCGHASVVSTGAVTRNGLVGALHKRVMFDMTGLWYADTPRQQEEMATYSRIVWGMEQHARHAFLRSLPCTALAVEVASTASRYRTPLIEF